MSPAHLNDFNAAGLSQLERALRRAKTMDTPACNAKCGLAAAEGCAGFCRDCFDLVPEQMQLALAIEPKVTVLVLATEWVRGIRKERADAR